MDALLNSDIKKQLEDFFKNLSRQVKLIIVTSDKDDADGNEMLVQLIEEVTATSSLLTSEVVLVENAKDYPVDKTPAIILLAQDGEDWQDYGIRIYGIPSGHEFGVLIHAIGLVSTGQSQLDEESIAFLEGLQEPVYLQVFSTPT